MALIAAATLLPFGAAHPEALPPRWCLACGGTWAADALSNILLFMPLGASIALSGRSWPAGLVAGAVISLIVETAQSLGFPPGRSPAVADVLSNSSGALIGWVAMRNGPRWWWSPVGNSAILALIWSVAALIMMSLTAAVEHRGADLVPTSVAISPFEYAPGYGWYGGQPVQAKFGTAGAEEWTVNHSGTGPIVARADQPSETWRVQVQSVGRDTARYRRAMVYLHLTQDSSSELLLAQRGHQAELLVRRRARDWGLAFPTLVLGEVFGEVAQRDTVVLEATATPSQLAVQATRAGQTRQVQLALTPLVGWTMVQTLIEVADPLAPVIQFLWLAVIFGPTAWWCARTGKIAMLLCALAVAGIGLFGIGPLMRVAPATLQDVLAASLIWSTAAATGWRSRRRSAESSREPIHQGHPRQGHPSGTRG